MKFTTVFAVIATVATAVSATLTTPLSGRDLVEMVPRTNAERLARGLPLLPPVRRGTPTYGPHKSKPSGIHNSCNSGPVQCCNSVTSANKSVREKIESLIGVVVAPDVAVGLTCSPLTALGLGHNSCSSQTVCCENNSFKGVVAIGCTPINVNLV